MATQQDDSQVWRRTTWGGILTLAAIVSTFGLACATPFAALIALAVLFLPRRDALLFVGVNFAVNQFIGFVFLHYPLTVSCYLGGLNLALACAVGAIAAMGAQKAMAKAGSTLSAVAVFAAVCVAFQATLHVGGLWRAHSELNPQTDLFIVYLNGLAFAGLLVMQFAATAFGLAAPRDTRGVAAAAA